MLIVPAFHIHIIHHSDGQQIQIPDGQPQLHTPQEEQMCALRSIPLGKSISIYPFYRNTHLFLHQIGGNL